MEELLVKVFDKGRCVYHSTSAMELQKICSNDLETLWEESKRLVNPHEVHVDLSKPLWDKKQELLDEYHGKNA